MHKLFGVVIADVVDARRRVPSIPAIRGNAIHKLQYYTSHVIDMSEVTAHPAMVKQPDRGAFDNRFGKQKNRHIGPSPWPIDGKKSQARDRKTIEVAVGMSHQFVGLFGRSV